MKNLLGVTTDSKKLLTEYKERITEIAKKGNLPSKICLDYLYKVMQWNSERQLLPCDNIDFNKELSFISEELSELMRASSEEEVVDALCDTFIFVSGFILKLESIITSTPLRVDVVVPSEELNLLLKERVNTKLYRSIAENHTIEIRASEDLNLRKLYLSTILTEGLHHLSVACMFKTDSEFLFNIYVTAYEEFLYKIISLIYLIGYSANEALKETLYEINSRTGAVNPKTGKWEKFKTEDAIALWYKADYKKCKRTRASIDKEFLEGSLARLAKVL